MNGFGQVSRYLWLISSIFLITGIFGYLYYSETERKEEYFNQLSFRTLGEVSRGLETNLSRLRNFTRQTRGDIAGLDSEIDLFKAKAEGSSAASDAMTSRGFEYAQEQLKKTVENFSWDETLDKKYAEVVRLYQVYTPKQNVKNPKVGTKNQKINEKNSQVEVKGFQVAGSRPPIACKKGDESNISLEGHDISCATVDLMSTLTTEFESFTTDKREPYDVEAMNELLGRIKTAMDGMEAGLGAREKLKEELEQRLIANDLAIGLAEDIIETINSMGPQRGVMIDFNIKQKYLPRVKKYYLEFPSTKLTKLLRGGECLVCDEEKRAQFVSLLEVDLDALREARQEGLNKEFFLKVADFVTDKIGLVYSDFSNFKETSNKSGLEIAKGKKKKYLDGSIKESTAAHDLKPRFWPDERCPLTESEKPSYPVTEGDNEIVDLCDKKLFLSPSKKLSPYPGSNFSVRSYLREKGSLEASLEVFLPHDIAEFSTLVIAAADGEVLQQMDSGSDVVSHKFLNIKQFVSEAIQKQRDNNSKTNKGEAPKSPKGEGSGGSDASLLRTATVDKDIDGIMYRVYIYPHKISESTLYIRKNQTAEKLIYVIGVKPLSKISQEKLSINSSTSVTLLSAALAVLLALVFLKIKLAHVDASFTRLEGAVAAVSVVIFLILAIVGSFSLAMSIQIEDNLREDAVKSFHKLKYRFGAEIESQLVQIDALLRSNRTVVGVLDGSGSGAGSDTETGTETETDVAAAALEIFINKICLAGPNADERYLTRNPPPNLGRERSFPLENLFMLNDQGKLTGPLLRGSRYMVRRVNPDLDLSGRKYFQSAFTNNVWEFDVEKPGRHKYWLCNAKPLAKEAPAKWFPIYLERIFNLGDGSLNTQLSIPVRHYSSGGLLFDAVNDYGVGEDPKVISAGFTLRTFQNPIMPRGQGFAVVENATGLVLYHSDNRRALVENFFQETENDVLLRALVETPAGMAESKDVEPSRFTGQYRGRQTEFFVDKLHPAIPWTLVIYQDSTQGQDIVPVMFALVMFITVSVMLVIALLLALSSVMKLRVINWLWPRTGEQQLYRRASITALMGIPIYYLILMLPFDSLSLIIAIITITAAILWWFRRLFKSINSTDEKVSDDIQGQYVVFVMSLLLLLTFAPATQISNKVADEVLQRVIAYNAVQQQKAAESAYVAIEKNIGRLCGAQAYKQSLYTECASIQPIKALSSNEILQLEKDANLARGTVIRELLQPTHLMVQEPEQERCSGGRIYCGELIEANDSKEPGASSERSRVINYPLELLRRSRWELPVLLDAVYGVGGPRHAISALDRSVAYQHKENFDNAILLIIRNPSALLLLLVAALVTAAIIRFLSIRLLGIAVPRSYRANYLKLNRKNWAAFTNGDIHRNDLEKDYSALCAQLTTGDRKLAILIRPTEARLKTLLASMDTEVIHLAGDMAPLDCHSLAGIEDKRALLGRHLKQSAYRRRVLVLESLEAVVFDREKRLVMLDMLEEVVHSGSNISVLLICDVAPLYMLIHQDRYVPNSMESEFADAQESMRWSRLLSQFDKYYGWSPMDIQFTDEGGVRGWHNTLLKECSAWPELYYLKGDLDALKTRKPGITPEQAIQYMASHAGPVYRRRWSFCTKEEKLLLYQLAKGQMINPMNAEPLEHLMRRGYIRRDPQWSVVSESFSRFVLSAEKENIYIKWMNASEQGLWKLLRIPLFTVALVILGILIYSAQETMESMMAIATSVLAFLPLLIRNLGQLGGVKVPSSPEG